MFATVRLRHDKTRPNANRKACVALVHKLCQSAERGFHRLHGSKLLSEVVAGVIYQDGVRKIAA
jgi:putative transposase